MNLHTMPVLIRLGKNGLTKGLIEEMSAQLKKKKSVKCRFLKSYPFSKDRKTDVERIAHILKAEVVSLKGFVFVLKRKGSETKASST